MKKLIKNFSVNNLTKTKNVTTGLFITTLFSMASCSKSDTPAAAPVATTPVVYQEENFLNSYLTTSSLNQTTTNYVNSGDNELGTEFVPLVKGKITGFLVKLPDPNSNLRITIWDKATGSSLATIMGNIATANTLTPVFFPGFDLVKNKEYAITMNTNDWYNRKKTDGTAVTYPITVGNIKVLSYKYKSGTAQSYPDTQNNTVYSGDLSFNFLRTE